MQGMQRQAVATTLTDQPIIEYTSERGTYLLNASLLMKTLVPRVILNFFIRRGGCAQLPK